MRAVQKKREKREQDGPSKRRKYPRYILTPRKPVTTVIGVRSESAADMVAKYEQRATVRSKNGLGCGLWVMGHGHFLICRLIPRGCYSKNDDDEREERERPPSDFEKAWVNTVIIYPSFEIK